MFDGPAIVMNEPPFFLEARCWEPKNPESLLAAEIRIISFIDANRKVYILGFCEFLNDFMRNVSETVIEELPTQHFTYDALVEWLWPDKRLRKDIRWFEMHSAIEADIDSMAGFAESMQMYVNARQQLIREVDLRCPFKDPDCIVLNCDATEVEQKLRAANRPWLSGTSE
jgi:hypothetical protein